jgi:multiple sugar transport system permease protein
VARAEEVGELLMATKKKIGVRVMITVFMLAVSISMLIPFLWMLSASFKRPADIFSYPIKWIPDYFYLDNYKYLFEHENVFLIYFNSIKITCINVAGACLTSSLAAYAFAKMKFRGRDLLFLIYISTLMVPAQATYVPKFVLFTQLGLRNTHAALILPGLFAVLGTFLMRQYFMQIPDSIIESASVDGARQLSIWAKIMLPMVKPALATFAIIVFAFHWNDYENPLIFISSKKLFTIPLALATFTDENGRMYHYIMALTSLAILPIFAVFLVGQRFFIEGMTAGAVKG